MSGRNALAGFSADQIEFYDEVKSWFDENTPEEVRGNAFMFGTMSVEQNRAWGRKLNERGWAAINWPKEHGGTGWDQMQKHLFEQARSDAGAPLVQNMGVAMLGPVLYSFGNEAQKQRYLPRILNFEDWWCQGYSEPGAGSDLASLQTRAVLDGDEYVINGSKIWTSYAHVANMIFCLVRTSNEGKKQEGISFIVFDMDTPGIDVRPIVSIDGEHHLNQVFFDNVRVPKENLIGEEGKGWTIAKYLLTHERTNIARLPMCFVQLDQIKTMARDEIGAGRLLEQENFAERIAEIELDLKCLEQTNAELLAATSAGKAPEAESSMLKIRGTEVQQALAELKLELAGPGAMPWGEPVEGLAESERATLRAAAEYFFSRASSIYGGSNEIQRNVMSKRILGF